MSGAKAGFGRVVHSVRGWRSTHWLLLVIAVLGAAVLYASFNYGQKMRAIAEYQLRETIAAEDRTFCEKFGGRPSTPQYIACCQELWIIRQKQADRESAADQSLP